MDDKNIGNINLSEGCASATAPVFMDSESKKMHDIETYGSLAVKWAAKMTQNSYSKYPDLHPHYLSLLNAIFLRLRQITHHPVVGYNGEQTRQQKMDDKYSGLFSATNWDIKIVGANINKVSYDPRDSIPKLADKEFSQLLPLNTYSLWLTLKPKNALTGIDIGLVHKLLWDDLCISNADDNNLCFVYGLVIQSLNGHLVLNVQCTTPHEGVGSLGEEELREYRNLMAHIAENIREHQNNVLHDKMNHAKSRLFIPLLDRTKNLLTEIEQHIHSQSKNSYEVPKEVRELLSFFSLVKKEKLAIEYSIADWFPPLYKKDDGITTVVSQTEKALIIKISGFKDLNIAQLEPMMENFTVGQTWDGIQHPDKSQLLDVIMYHAEKDDPIGDDDLFKASRLYDDGREPKQDTQKANSSSPSSSSVWNKISSALLMRRKKTTDSTGGNSNNSSNNGHELFEPSIYRRKTAEKIHLDNIKRSKNEKDATGIFIACFIFHLKQKPGVECNREQKQSEETIASASAAARPNQDSISSPPPPPPPLPINGEKECRTPISFPLIGKKRPRPAMKDDSSSSRVEEPPRKKMVLDRYISFEDSNNDNDDDDIKGPGIHADVFNRLTRTDDLYT